MLPLPAGLANISLEKQNLSPVTKVYSWYLAGFSTPIPRYSRNIRLQRRGPSSLMEVLLPKVKYRCFILSLATGKIVSCFQDERKKNDRIISPGNLKFWFSVCAVFSCHNLFIGRFEENFSSASCLGCTVQFKSENYKENLRKTKKEIEWFFFLFEKIFQLKCALGKCGSGRRLANHQTEIQHFALGKIPTVQFLLHLLVSSPVWRWENILGEKILRIMYVSLYPLCGFIAVLEVGEIILSHNLSAGWQIKGLRTWLRGP